jgi:hypothetical protein
MMTETIAKALKGEISVVINAAMGDRVRVKNGHIHAGSVEAFQREMKAALVDWVALRTVPPTLMNTVTGELIEIPETPATVPARCERCGVRHV